MLVNNQSKKRLSVKSQSKNKNNTKCQSKINIEKNNTKSQSINQYNPVTCTRKGRVVGVDASSLRPRESRPGFAPTLTRNKKKKSDRVRYNDRHNQVIQGSLQHWLEAKRKVGQGSLQWQTSTGHPGFPLTLTRNKIKSWTGFATMTDINRSSRVRSNID